MARSAASCWPCADKVADLRGRHQLPAGRWRHVHDVPVRRRAPGPDLRTQRCGPRPDHGGAGARGQTVARALLPVTVVFLTANASLGAVLMPFGIERLGGSEHTGLLLSCLGVGFLAGAPVTRALLDRAQPRTLLTASLTATAAAYLLLFTSTSLATALPAAAVVAMSGSMALAVQQTTLQRVIPGAVLGRVSVGSSSRARRGDDERQGAHFRNEAVQSKAMLFLRRKNRASFLLARNEICRGWRWCQSRAGLDGRVGRIVSAIASRG